MSLRKVFLRLFFLIFVLTGCGRYETQSYFVAETANVLKSPKSREEITIGTYNVENLFDGVAKPGRPIEKPKKPENLAALAEAIRTIKADVLALQEVESKATLKSFRDKYLADLGYHYLTLVEGNDPRGIDVAVISRFPIKDFKSHRNVKFGIPEREQGSFSRDLLQVDLQTPGNYNFTLFVAHLKAQLGGDQADQKREAESKKIRYFLRRFAKENPKANFALLGDFNDTPDSKSLAPLLKPEKSDLNLHDLVTEELGNGSNIYSYHKKPYISRIDYLLVSPTMKNEYLKNSITIHQPVGEKMNFFLQASDHLPVTARFQTNLDR